jgi:hypothetical protein
MILTDRVGSPSNIRLLFLFFLLFFPRIWDSRVQWYSSNQFLFFFSTFKEVSRE